MKQHITILVITMLLGCADKKNRADQIPQGTGSKYQFEEVSTLTQQTTLPSLIVDPHGDSIETIPQWELRRDYIKQMLTFYQYGQMPPKPTGVRVIETSNQKKGEGMHQSYDFTIFRNEKSLTFQVGLIRPSGEGPYPIIIKNDRYRFDMNEIENEKSKKKYIKQNRLAIDFFVAEEAVKRGYIYCKFNRDDVALDVKGPKTGRAFELYPEYDWGAIAAWAWAYQIIIDWIEKQSFVDKSKIVVTGHSRGGKTALCAGIYDERIAITAPNSSGLGGTASLRFYDFSRGNNVQTIAYQSRQHQHWWPDRWFTLKDHIEKIPFDAHFSKALIAPRALFNSHARHDLWANPYGTQLTYIKAQSVFDLYDRSRNNAIHWRDGGHAQGKEDWLALFDYCDLIFYNKASDRKFDQNLNPERFQYDMLEQYDITKLKESPAE